jgi:hypothetical protein
VSFGKIRHESERSFIVFESFAWPIQRTRRQTQVEEWFVAKWMLSGRLTIFRVCFLECLSLSQCIGHAQTGGERFALIRTSCRAREEQDAQEARHEILAVRSAAGASERASERCSDTLTAPHFFEKMSA